LKKFRFYPAIIRQYSLVGHQDFGLHQVFPEHIRIPRQPFLMTVKQLMLVQRKLSVSTLAVSISIGVCPEISNQFADPYWNWSIAFLISLCDLGFPGFPDSKDGTHLPPWHERGNTSCDISLPWALGLGKPGNLEKCGSPGTLPAKKAHDGKNIPVRFHRRSGSRP